MRRWQWREPWSGSKRHISTNVRRIGRIQRVPEGGKWLHTLARKAPTAWPTDSDILTFEAPWNLSRDHRREGWPEERGLHRQIRGSRRRERRRRHPREKTWRRSMSLHVDDGCWDVSRHVLGRIRANSQMCKHLKLYISWNNEYQPNFYENLKERKFLCTIEYICRHIPEEHEDRQMIALSFP